MKNLTSNIRGPETYQGKTINGISILKNFVDLTPEQLACFKEAQKTERAYHRKLERFRKKVREANLKGAEKPDLPCDISPSVVSYPGGRLKRITYNVDYKQHRVDGPAVVEWYESGQKSKESYYQHGKLHRLPSEGPAGCLFGEDGTVIMEGYYWEGEEVDSKFSPPRPIIYEDGLGRAFV